MKALLLFILCGSAYAESPRNTKSEAGKFQLIQLSESRFDQYLLDSQTGRMWQSSCEVTGDGSGPASCKYLVWLPVDLLGINATEGQILKKIDHHSKKALFAPPTEEELAATTRKFNPDKFLSETKPSN